MTFMDEPMAKNMSFQREYAEPYEWVAQQFKDCLLYTSHLPTSWVRTAPSSFPEDADNRTIPAGSALPPAGMLSAEGVPVWAGQLPQGACPGQSQNPCLLYTSPTSGIINGGCGTINPAVTDMAISPFTGREFSQSPPKYLSRSGRKTGYTYDTYTIAQNPVRAQIPVLYFL